MKDKKIPTKIFLEEKELPKFWYNINKKRKRRKIKMAKLGFTKLGLKPNNEIKIVEFNEQIIEVKQYLPIELKLELITNVLEFAHDENNYSNPIKVQVYTLLEIIEKYTNINFTEKQKENPTKLYDLIVGSELEKIIISAIPEQEYFRVINGIETTTNAIYTYRNSLLGILDTVVKDYNNLDLDAVALQEKMANPEELALLKGIMSKLGWLN